MCFIVCQMEIALLFKKKTLCKSSSLFELHFALMQSYTKAIFYRVIVSFIVLVLSSSASIHLVTILVSFSHCISLIQSFYWAHYVIALVSFWPCTSHSHHSSLLRRVNMHYTLSLIKVQVQNGQLLCFFVGHHVMFSNKELQLQTLHFAPKKFSIACCDKKMK